MKPSVFGIALLLLGTGIWLLSREPVALSPMPDSPLGIAPAATSDAKTVSVVPDSPPLSTTPPIDALPSPKKPSCASLYPAIGERPAVDAWADAVSGAAEVLSLSTTAEHLLVAALILGEQNSEAGAREQVALLERSLALGGASPLILWHAINLCSTPTAPDNCRLEDWERQLLAIDSLNSETWIRVAANQYRRGDHGNALASLQRAATAGESNTFLPQTAAAITRGMGASSNLNFAQRAIIGMSKAPLPQYGDYLGMCREMAAQNDWAQACLDYGNLAQRRSNTLMGVSVGIALQELIHELAGREAATAKVRSQKTALLEKFFELATPESFAKEFAWVNTPHLWWEYLESIQNSNELEALVFIRRRLDEHLERYPELDCVLPEAAPEDTQEAEPTEYALPTTAY